MSVSILTRPPTCLEMALRITRRSLITPVMPVILKYSYCSKEYQFISKDKSFVERFLCPICQEILYKPVQTSCGHLFCGKCLKRVRSKNCPSCRAEFIREPIEDKFNEREIRNLIVKCQNSSRGCEWEGELGNVESHQNGVCGYQLVQCGNKCGAEMERREVEKHEEDDCELRMYMCPYCWFHRDTYKRVTSEHFKECVGFPLGCPNNCGKKRIRRGDMSSHLCACPKEVVPCRYQSLGCRMRLPRKQMDEHLSDKEIHLDLAMVTTSELVTEHSVTKMAVSNLEKQVENLVAKLNKVKFEHSVSIRNLKKQMSTLLEKTSTKVELPPPVPPSKPWLKEDSFHRYPPCTLRVELDEDRRGVSPHFFSHPGGYRLELRAGHYCINAVDHPDNYPLKWPIKITVNYVFLNQEEDKYHVHRKYSREITSPKDTEPIYDLVYQDLPPRYIKDNSLYVKITSIDVQ